jgi:HicA toxin of bacterial toxin-antitoxin,
MNSKQTKTLAAVKTLPVNGNLVWSDLESLLKALGCECIEGPGSSVTFACRGRRLTIHRPHPNKEALRYRVKAVQEFIALIESRP